MQANVRFLQTLTFSSNNAVLIRDITSLFDVLPRGVFDSEHIRMTRPSSWYVLVGCAREHQGICRSPIALDKHQKFGLLWLFQIMKHILLRSYGSESNVTTKYIK